MEWAHISFLPLIIIMCLGTNINFFFFLPDWSISSVRYREGSQLGLEKEVSQINSSYSKLTPSLVLSGKKSACQAGDTGSIPGLGRSPGEGNGHPVQYSCLGNPMDRGAWQTTVRGVTKSQSTA